jgi:hypothetical protein
MKDLVITLVGLALLSSLMLTQGNIIENFGLNPPMTVSVQPEIVLSGSPQGNSSAAQALGLGAEKVYQGEMVTAPVSMQAMLSPRFDGTNDYGASIRYNMPAMQNLGVPANPLTYGPSQMLNAPQMSGKGGCVKEGYEDTESFEPISNAAAQMGQSGMRLEQAQALADDGLIKARSPQMTLQTSEGPVAVTVYDRLMYSTSRSRLYGQGDPIRGDIGCIVPVKDQWFRPSVRPNVDLRPGAMTIMGGIENDTSRELRALQNLSSAGVSNLTSDAYANTVAPGLAQKSMSLSGAPGGGQADISVAATF